MTKEEKKYCKIGQAVCNLFSAIVFFTVPVMACNLAGYICTLF